MEPHELTVGTIAGALGLTPEALEREVSHYEAWFMPSRRERVGSGKVRVIDEPWRGSLSHPGPRERLQGLHRRLQRLLPMPHYVCGGVRHRSCFTSARYHLGSPFVATVDITDCFPSMGPVLLRRELSLSGFAPDVAAVLARLMTVRERVPQGSPLSTEAVNLCLLPLDRDVAALCDERGLRYSRVYDDIIVSGRDEEAVTDAAAYVKLRLNEMQLRPSEKKWLERGLQRAKEGPRVHGILTGDPRGTRITREHRAKALRAGEAYVRAARRATIASLETVQHKRQVVFGWVSYIGQSDLTSTKHLRRLMRDGDRHLARKALRVTATHQARRRRRRAPPSAVAA